VSDLPALLVVWLNVAANAVGRPLLAPVAVLPGWLSATIVAAATGVVFLIVFKYTSNQRAVKRVRDDINAQLLALKLFKDSTRVALRAQGRLLWGAVQLFGLAIVPMLVMIVPACLILGQLSIWYQFRPLRVGEDAVVTVKLKDDSRAALAELRLEPVSGIEVLTGPVRVESKREVCWNVKAVKDGYHRLEFQAGGATPTKELAVGGDFLRVNRLRPAWNWADILMYPYETPFRRDSLVQSIEIDYPRRSSWTSGTDSWVIYWFVVSMIGALCFRRLLNVNI
jgi:hypothetical protein